MSQESQIPKIQQRSVEELIQRNLVLHNRGLLEIQSRFKNTVIVKALDLCAGDVETAAKMLKVSEIELSRWINQFGLNEPGSLDVG